MTRRGPRRRPDPYSYQGENGYERPDYLRDLGGDEPIGTRPEPLARPAPAQPPAAARFGSLLTVLQGLFLFLGFRRATPTLTVGAGKHSSLCLRFVCSVSDAVFSVVFSTFLLCFPLFLAAKPPKTMENTAPR